SKATSRTGIASRRRETLDPVPRDVLAPADPDLAAAADVLDEPDQRLGPAGMAGEAHVQPDRHHARTLGALVIEQVEAVAQICESVAAIASAAGGFASNARAQANSVTGTWYRVKMRCSRQNPTLLPYSNMLSAPRSRRLPASVLALSISPVSDTPSPAGCDS